MKNILKNRKGFTLSTVVVSVVLMLIILSTIILSGNNTTESKKALLIINDVEELTRKSNIFYIQNGFLPMDESIKCDFSINDLSGKGNSEVKYSFYKLNTSNFENLNLLNKEDEDHFYIINEKTHLIYYVEKIEEKIVPVKYSNKNSDLLEKSTNKDSDLLEQSTELLADVVKVGDYVNIGLEYNNVGEYPSELTGWRVLSSDNSEVKLISAGTPLAYYNNKVLTSNNKSKLKNLYRDLNDEIREYKEMENSGKWVVTNIFSENGFKDNNLENVFGKNKYVNVNDENKNIHIMNISEYSNFYNGIAQENTLSYYIYRDWNYLAHCYNGELDETAASSSNSIGVRVVLTLKHDVEFYNNGNDGSTSEKAYILK